MDALNILFNPQSVAVIGASQDSAKIGHTILANIINSGYRGKLYPINPKGGSILGLPVYKRLSDIEDEDERAAERAACAVARAVSTSSAVAAGTVSIRLSSKGSRTSIVFSRSTHWPASNIFMVSSSS